MTPNIIHYVYPAWPNTRPLSYVNYICVKSAIENHNPDKVKFWIDGDPVDNEWWRKIQDMVTVERRPMKGSYGGVNIEWPQHQSDVTRLEILKEEGGIYFDTDVLVLQSIDWLLGDEFVIGMEPGGNSLCNAVMLSPKNHSFIDEWLEVMPGALASNEWAKGGVVAPLELAQGRIWDLILQDAEDFCPFDLHYPYAFEPRLIRATEALIRYSSTIHLFETYWRDTIKNITPEWVEKNDCYFSRFVKGEIE
jgi:hypothetical protein